CVGAGSLSPGSWICKTWTGALSGEQSRGERLDRQTLETDYLVLGSGIAGLSFALRAAAHGRVLIVTKRMPEESATNQAQGGISAVLSPEDSIEAHVADTLTVGDGLCSERIVRIACEEA